MGRHFGAYERGYPRPAAPRRAWDRARAALAALGLLAACAAPPEAPAPPPVPEPEAARPAPAPPPPGPCLQIIRIHVYKDRRILYAECEGGAVVRFPVALGRGTRGDKEEAGDLRTPEGHYRISGAPRPSRFHRFLPIDYPSRKDAEAARRDGRITAADYARIVAAHERGESPPADTPLGGRIGFHGEGERWRGESSDLDWTYGCIALRDADLDFVIEHTPIGTAVAIEGPP